MRRREASINDVPIDESERRIFGPPARSRAGAAAPAREGARVIEQARQALPLLRRVRRRDRGGRRHLSPPPRSGTGRRRHRDARRHERASSTRPAIEGGFTGSTDPFRLAHPRLPAPLPAARRRGSRPRHLQRYRKSGRPALAPTPSPWRPVRGTGLGAVPVRGIPVRGRRLAAHPAYQDSPIRVRHGRASRASRTPARRGRTADGPSSAGTGAESAGAEFGRSLGLRRRLPFAPSYLRTPPEGRSSNDAVREARLDRPGRLPDLPRLHELRRARPRRARWTLDEEAVAPAHPAGARGRDQLLRHGRTRTPTAPARRSSAGRCATSPAATRS